MGVIDPGNEIVNESSCEYWQNELVNTRILLNELNIAINTVLQTGIASYTLDTGQSRQTVTRQDMSALIERRNNLMEQIRMIELYLGIGKPGVYKVEPAW